MHTGTAKIGSSRLRRLLQACVAASLLLATGAPAAFAGETGKSDKTEMMPSLDEMKAFSSTLGGGAAMPAPKTPVTPKGPHGSANPHYKLPPDKLLLVALQHLSEGRPQEAMRTLNMAIARYPDDYKLRGVRASLYLQHRQYAKALADLEVALKQHPDDPLLLVNRAQAYRGFKRSKEALDDLNHAIRIKPDFVGALFNRGALLFEQKRYKEALADFEKVASLNPHLPAARFNIAVTYEALGNRKQAMKELEDFLKVAKHKGWIAVARKQLNNWRKMEGLPPIDFDTAEKNADQAEKAGKADQDAGKTEKAK